MFSNLSAPQSVDTSALAHLPVMRHFLAEIVFHPQGYRGISNWILANFRQGIYPDLPLLVWMGLTTTEEFPRMTRWPRE